MYIVTLINGDIETPIHGEKEKLQSGTIVKGINAIDSFTFTMLPSNAGFDLINEFTTLVNVYNTNKNRYEFMGRVLCPESEMSEAGLLTKKVTCESLFGYLCDSQQKYVNTQNWTVSGLLKHLIDCHNSQVEAHKKFTVGKVTATDANNNLYLGIQRENTWDAIKSNLIDKIGGELQFRVEDGVIYIDYLEEIGEEKETEIALSVNMKSIIREKDPTAFVTRLIPLGAKLSDETEERLDITSVNGGLNFIDDAEAVKKYGIHVGTVLFDDVTKATNLLAKGRNWLEENNKVQVKYTVSALDLSLIGLAFDDFECGNSYPIRNALLDIYDTARIVKQTIDICNDVASSFDIGDNFKTLSDIEIEQRKAAAQNIATLQKTASGLQSEVNNTKQDLNALSEKVELLGEPLTPEEVFNVLCQNGTLQGLYTADGKLYINASYIASGVLKGIEIIGEKGKIGGFSMSKETLTSAYRKEYPTFTEADLDKLTAYYLGSGELTDEEIDKYDVNMNGRIDSGDAVIIRQMMNGLLPTYSVGKFTLNTSDPKNTMVLEITEGYRAGEKTVIGLGGINSSAIYVGSSSTSALPLQVSSAEELEPDVYRVFGEVSSLDVKLVAVNDGKAHEYCFEFIPTANFTHLNITPTPEWTIEPRFTVGKPHQVSILRGVGVMICA